MYSAVSVPLDLDRASRRVLWRERLRQNQAYNLGVEIGLGSDGIPMGAYAGFKALTHRRQSGAMPRHAVRLQRPGMAAGLAAVAAHRKRRYALERSLAYWEGLRGTDRFNPVRHSRTAQRLERHTDKGSGRLYRSRKKLERTNGPALVLHEGAKIADGLLVLPGKVVLRLGAAVEIPEGAALTGAVQVVDVTTKVTRRTQPHHRRYKAVLFVRSDDPGTAEPESREDVLGVDAGVVVQLQCSDGSQYMMPDERESAVEIRALKRERSQNHTPGSRRWKHQSRRIGQRYRKQRNQRIDASRRIAKSVAAKPQKVVSSENLRLSDMVHSAKGTAAASGRNVRAKTGLNRSLNRACLARLLTDLERACLKAGKAFLKVPPQGTSQHCHRCGAKGRRETQAQFSCSTGCGWAGNADLNASRNIARLAWERWPGRSSPDGTQAEPAGATSQTTIGCTRHGHYLI